MKKQGFVNLSEMVIQRGLCTGCGTCIGVCPAEVIQFDFDREQPALEGQCTYCGLCCSVCPGENIPLLKLERQIFGEERTRSNELLGISKAFLKGFATDPRVRQAGASGGLTTALLIYLLEQGKIDGAIITSMDRKRPWRVRPVLAKTKEEFIQGAQSKYAISPNNMILKDTAGVNRLAVVGLPCHIYGIRKLQTCGKAKALAQKIVFTLGIFCGSNQSYKVTEHLIRECSDIQLNEIKQFEYRGGKDSQNVRILTKHNREITISSEARRELGRTMINDRCRVCCDFTSELADVSLGDIFDPLQNRRVPQWNSLIVRTEKARQIIEEARIAGAIEISALEEDSFYDNRGFASKKYGGVYHLGERKRHGWPVPNYHYEFALQPKRKSGNRRTYGKDGEKHHTAARRNQNDETR